MPTPWWFSSVERLGEASATSTLGECWSRSERVRFIRDTMDAKAVAQDVAGSPLASERWATFLALEQQAFLALEAATGRERAFLAGGGRPPEAFRAHWEALGFVAHVDFGGTPADDYLDALFSTSRLRYEAAAAAGANVNLGSRAARVSDFLDVTRPGAADVVFDLGSGSGKLALTVAASTVSSVLGVELLDQAVADARSSAHALGLDNASFAHADVRDVDLAAGSIFYLYYPFRGAVASTVAATLGALARDRPITIYASGPVWDYGEFFLREVDSGALRLRERRG
jgi:23S rRNA (uracil1939-C5)-methyltransferase